MKFQFKISHLIIATTWAAIFWGNFVLARQSLAYSGFLGGTLYASLIIIPPAAIVGAIADRHLLGILCGVAALCGVYLETWVDA